MFGVSVNSGVKPISVCDLKEGDTFYIFIPGGTTGPHIDLTRIEERKVEEISTWTEHWHTPDYLEDGFARECRLVYSFKDTETGEVERVVLPKVPSDWTIFRTEKEAARYAVDYLEAQEKKLRESLGILSILEEKFSKLL